MFYDSISDILFDRRDPLCAGKIDTILLGCGFFIQYFPKRNIRCHIIGVLQSRNFKFNGIVIVAEGRKSRCINRLSCTINLNYILFSIFRRFSCNNDLIVIIYRDRKTLCGNFIDYPGSFVYNAIIKFCMFIVYLTCNQMRILRPQQTSVIC